MASWHEAHRALERERCINNGLRPYLRSRWELLGGSTESARLATIRGEGVEYSVLSLEDGRVIVVFVADGPYALPWMLWDEPVRYVDALERVAAIVKEEACGG